MINKVDRAIMELKLNGEEIYQQFKKVIDNVNVVIGTYQNEDSGDIFCDPSIGNVIFGAGKDQWAFNLKTFARFYEKKFGINQNTLMKKFWGDNYFDPELQKWTDEPATQSGKPIKRAFVEYIMEPICVLSNLILQAQR